MKIFVKVKSNTSQEKIEQKDSNYFEIWTKKPAINGKANKDILNLLAEYFKISLSEISIISGFKSREKIIQINEKK